MSILPLPGTSGLKIVLETMVEEEVKEQVQ
jgi:hypothetical protein